MEMKKVSIYTDGSCRLNGEAGAAGGWSAILQYKDSQNVLHERQLNGYESNSSNNRMELTAVVEGLKALRKPCEVSVFSDSTYVASYGLSMQDWQNRGWKRKDGKNIANAELWQELGRVAREGGHTLSFHHCRSAEAQMDIHRRAEAIARKESMVCRSQQMTMLKTEPAGE